MALERLLHEPYRCLVSCLGDVALEHFALLVDRSPQVMHLAVDLHIHLVEVSLPMTEAPHPADPLASHVRSEHWAQPAPPVPHGLMADVDPALCQQVFHIAQAQRKADVHHHYQPDNIGRRVEIAERAVRFHWLWAFGRPALQQLP